MERMIERVVEERNLMGVLAATKDHNVCALCKSWQVSGITWWWWCAPVPVGVRNECRQCKR